MIDVIEVDAVTGEVTTRGFTAGELEQRETDQAAALAAAQAEEAAAAEAAAAIASAQDELKSLGLSDSAVQAISGHPYPQPAP